MPKEIFDKSFYELTMEEIAFEAVKQIKRVADGIQDQNEFYMAETAKREAEAEAKSDNSPDDEADGAGSSGEAKAEENTEDGEGI